MCKQFFYTVIFEEGYTCLNLRHVIEAGNENKVCLLKRAIYVLKSSHVWNKEAKKVLIKLDYKQCEHEPCVFTLRLQANL